MVDRSRSKASGIRAKSQSSDPVAVVTKDLRCGGGKKRVVNGERCVGRGSSDEMFGFLVPYDGAEGNAAALLSVGLPHFH